MKTVSTIAATKVRMMKSSVRCLTFGLLGLLPIIGVPFALAGIWSSFVAHKQEKSFWNPAKPHRIAGLVCAAIGLLVWGALDTIIIFNAFNSYVAG